MAFCELRWSSKVIGKQVGSYVLLPDVGDGPFPVFYLLHGLSDDYTIWHRRTRIEFYAAAYPMIVVMPDGFRGFYTNNHHGPRYADYIAQELPELIERQFHARTSGKARCVGGLSMGGYGALRIGLGFPGRFTSITSHSGALLRTRRNSQNMSEEEARLFGPNPSRGDHDLVVLARRAKAAGRLPKIRIDCGTEDFLLDENRRYHAELNKLRIAHEYQEFPGNHSWDYWDKHVQTALSFHAAALGLNTGSKS